MQLLKINNILRKIGLCLIITVDTETECHDLSIRRWKKFLEMCEQKEQS